MPRKIQPPDSKRKTPVQTRAAETIKTIYEATAQLLQSGGHTKLSTNKIAEKAGFSIGTLYQYFPNKEAVLLAMARYERDRINAQIREALVDAEALPLEDVIRRIVRILLKAFGGRQRTRKFLIRSLLNYGDLASFITAQNEIISFIISEMRRVCRADIRAPDETMSFVMSRSLIGTIRASVMEESKLYSTKAFEDELVLLVRNYIHA